ncbi:UNVERIFIED_CONTAM: hypothetical protein QE387_000778 [Pseudacidovorax intermedius]|nr:hypothetical protein [Pseudacidovorax intermedius]
MNSLIDKYNIPGPRYTSYPTVPYWDESSFSPQQWEETVIRSFPGKQCGGRHFHLYPPAFLRGFVYVLCLSQKNHQAAQRGNSLSGKRVERVEALPESF